METFKLSERTFELLENVKQKLLKSYPLSDIQLTDNALIMSGCYGNCKGNCEGRCGGCTGSCSGSAKCGITL